MSRKKLFEEVYSVLSTVTGLTGVFDAQAPTEQVSPYVVVGPSQELRGRCINDGERLLIVDIHVWSSYQGRAEILALTDAIDATMPSDYLFDNLTILKDEESSWHHGILTYRVYFKNIRRK